jgi:hypothetical protein
LAPREDAARIVAGSTDDDRVELQPLTLGRGVHVDPLVQSRVAGQQPGEVPASCGRRPAPQ